MTAPDLADFRRQMDAVNHRLCAVLQERAQLALRIGAWKRAHGLPIADATREQEMLARTLAQAGPGFDPKTLHDLLAQVFAATRQLLERAPA